MALLIFYCVLTLFISFLCSTFESVILSITPAYVGLLKKKRGRTGILLAELKKQIDRPLAAILTLNTIANTVGSIGVGTQTLKIFGSQWLAVCSALLTFSILIFSEIIPKSLGASYWKPLAPITAYCVKGLMVALYPFVILSEVIMSRLTKGKPLTRMTREEMIIAAEIGESDGTLMKKETRIIKNLLQLNNIFVKDVMTPRSVILALQQDLTVDDVVGKYILVPFSRIPVFKQSIDEITGVVLRFKILEAHAQDDEKIKLKELAQPISSISQDMSVAWVLDEFIKKREHIFLALDNYGVTTGIVTLEDAVETLLGVEIVDESDSVADLRKFAQDQWEKRKRTVKFRQKKG